MPSLPHAVAGALAEYTYVTLGRAAEGRGQGRAGDDIPREAQQLREGARARAQGGGCARRQRVLRRVSASPGPRADWC